MKLIKKRQNKEAIKVSGPWKEDLIWCPSQCYLPVEFRGRKLTLYLRWRSDDPWTFEIWFGPNLHSKWSMDLFKKYRRYWTENDKVKKVEEDALKIAQRFLNSIPKTEFLLTCYKLKNA